VEGIDEVHALRSALFVVQRNGAPAAAHCSVKAVTQRAGAPP
jgi:hypothetical protein